MNQLLLRTQMRFDDEEAVAQCVNTDFNPDSARLLQYPNHSLNLEQEDIIKLYSKTLITLVMECLVRSPLHRPSSIELVRRTRDGLRAALAVSEDTIAELPLPAGIDKIPYVNQSNGLIVRQHGTSTIPRIKSLHYPSLRHLQDFVNTSHLVVVHSWLEDSSVPTLPHHQAYSVAPVVSSALQVAKALSPVQRSRQA